MNVVIFSGGSGSEQLQKGLHHLFGSSINVYIIINGYDDGKSTGIVRKIYNNMILGPSDLRKNHLLIHKLHFGESALYTILNHRFTSQAAYKYVLDYIELYKIQLQDETYYILLKHIHLFFSREETKQYSFDDFNIGNIIYASLFFEEGVQRAASILCDILMIPNRVLFHNNEPLQLKAITRNRNILNTENEIVNFNSDDDIITGIYLENNNNEHIIPELDDSVIYHIQHADMIIFSCGTQWSSLFPTYHSNNFHSIIQSTLCKKYLFINIAEDNDMKHVPIESYFDLYRLYLPMDDITFIFSRDGQFKIPQACPYTCILFDNVLNNKIHKPNETIIQLFKYHLKDYLQYTHYIFDYDYTLYDSKQKELSDKILIELYNLYRRKSILSNNDISNIHIERTDSYNHIICNLGSYDYINQKDLSVSYHLTSIDKQHIYRILLPYSSLFNMTITDRIFSICIKPVDNRDRLCKEFNHHLLHYNLKCIKTGKTSLEITKLVNHKDNGLLYIIQHHPDDSFLYVSDMDDVTIDTNKYIISSLSHVHILLVTLNNISHFLPDLIVIAGGKNTRNNNIPKGMCIIENSKSVIDTLYNKSKSFIRNMYVFTIDKYMNDYKSNTYKTINCTPSTLGNRDTFEIGIKQISSSSYTIICWSDAIVFDSIVFAELSVSYDDFRIPCRAEKNPYAYLCVNNESIYDIRFQKTEPIEYGLHDLSIFQLCPSNLLQLPIDNEPLLERNLFDYIRYSNSIIHTSYYISSSRIESFNTVEELHNILSS